MSTTVAASLRNHQRRPSPIMLSLQAAADLDGGVDRLGVEHLGSSWQRWQRGPGSLCQVVLASAKGSTEDAPAWRSNRAAKVIVQPESTRSSTSNMGPEVLDTAVAASDKLSRRHRSANRWALFVRRGGGPCEVSVPRKSSHPIAAS